MSIADRLRATRDRLNKPAYIALIILAAASAWVLSGVLSGTHVEEKAPAIAAANAAGQKGPVSVRVRTMRNEDHVADVVLRGRTEAERKVQLKAEMAARVTGLPAQKGQLVKAGDPICELDIGARQAQLDQANAQLKQAELEYAAATELASRGNKAKTQVAAAKAALEAAQANVRLMQTNLGYATIRAPFDGVVGQRYVAIGDYVTPGTPCAFIVGAEPFLVVGAVSEGQIAAVSTGSEGTATLVTGETVNGTVTFLANAADEKTRTFRIEMTVPNADFALHDGVTADLRVKSRTVQAMRVSPAILSLNDEGKIGVKIVETNVARFVPVTLIDDSPDGVWIAGLPNEATIITVGHDYVKDGDPVAPVAEGPVTAAGDTAEPAQAN